MEFLYPNVLFFMLIPTILLAFLLTTNKKSIENFFTKEALDKLTVQNNHMKKNTRIILFFIAILLMTISLARPVLNKKEQKIKQEKISYVIAVDISKSMLAQDVKPSRFIFAKNKLLKLLDLSKDKEVGVILFSNNSYILSPLTKDIDSLKQIISRVDERYTFDNGSNVEVAIKTAKKLLRFVKHKNLVILTDGTDTKDFSKIINTAKKDKISVYTIAIGTENKTPIKLKNGDFLTDNSGSIITTSVNENIKDLSLNTNGAFTNYTLDNYDVTSIINQVTKNSTKQQDKQRKLKIYTELFYYPLALALLILLISFSSLPKSRYLPFLLIFFIHTDANASITDFKTIDNATKAYQSKEYAKAEKEFKKVAKNAQGYYNLANSLYKERKYKEALKNYKKVITSDDKLQFKKLHNLGNTYTKLNKLEDAVKMYKKALKIKKDEQTKQNLKIVEDALKKQKKNNKDNKDNKNKKNQNKKEQKQNKNQNQKNSDQKKNNNQKQKQKNKDQQQEQKQKNQQQKQKNKQESKSNKKNKKQINKQKVNSSKVKQNIISNREEKKWLRKIENNNLGVFIKKDEESKSNTKW
ncbi:VWA domain-containing protein [Arcobacter sp. CECT 8985]|uniref:VWA domain-containing protein n=1 Tax=Arcobacter sp. CECT 8985 TaxID=1935424 RepID=UPI00100AE828|nr:VWA domain-containing protein [Arcobacter sp. CECT 8985]RXJ84559.1 hypothetical protein CRU93_12375 [Arcobacter sp. CECT 8985]